ncbi:hypothetical protein ACQ4LE_003865 [Meloidogyne hapla]|uniref:Uncharacterized protein n=1 Tax=Meloidogyne hapla TaxID=6305 RepID=A0A1I8B6J4_MELHA
MFLFIRPNIPPIIRLNINFDLNLQWDFQSKINGFRQFSSKVEDETMKNNQIQLNKPFKFKSLTIFQTETEKEQKEKLEVGYPLLVNEWESLQKKWADERDQFREQLEQEKPLMIEPTDFQRKMVVWSGMYSNLSEVPTKLNSYQVKEHGKSLIRRFLLMIFVFYISLHYIYRCDETENMF